MHPAALLLCDGPDFANSFPEPKRSIGDCELGRDDQAAVPQIQQQFAPVLSAFACAVGEAEQFFLPFGRCADQDENALLFVLEPGL